MRYLLLLFFVITWLSHHALAAEAVVIHSIARQSSQWSALGKDDYEDVRADSNLDGKIDYWKIRKGNLIVEFYLHEDKIYRYSIKRFKGNFTQEIEYIRFRGNLVLNKKIERKQDQLGYSEKSEVSCKLDPINNNFSDLITLEKEVTSESAAKASVELIDRSCSDRKIANPRAKLIIQDALSSFLSGNSKPINIQECLESDSFSNLFESDPDRKLFAVKLLATYLSRIRFLTNFPYSNRPLIVCEKEGSESAVTMEDGKIIFRGLPSGAQIQHEVLHSIGGISSEKDLHMIEEICTDLGAGRVPKNPFEGFEPKTQLPRPNQSITDASKNASDTSSANIVGAKPQGEADRPNRQTAVEAVASKSTAATIPQSISESLTGAPVPDKRSVHIAKDRSETPGGVAAASYRATGGVISAAGAFIDRAFASSQGASLGEGPARIRNSSGSKASSNKARRREPTRNIASASKKTNPGKVGEDEFVKESIVVNSTPQTDRGAKVDNLNPGRRDSASRLTSDGKPGPSIKNLDANPSTRRTSSFSSPSRMPAGSQDSAADGGGRRRSRSASGTERASNTPQPAGNYAQLNRADLVDKLKSTPYSTMQEELSKPTLQGALAEKRITIITETGKTIGYKHRGSAVIFRDTGERFVEQ